MTAEPLTQDPPPCLGVSVVNPDSGLEPESLLHLYLNANYDLRAVAEQTDIPLTDLLDWLESPETQRILDRLRAAAADSLALRATEARRTAIDTLERVLLESDDPIEQRRAATALLRALNTRPRATTDSNARLAPQSPPNAECRMPNVPRDVVAHALDALSQRAALDPDEALATLHACCAPGATINNEPIPDNAEDLIDDHPDLAEHLHNHVQAITDPPTRTDESYDQHLCIVHPRARCVSLDLRLEPLGRSSLRADALGRSPLRADALDDRNSENLRDSESPPMSPARQEAEEPPEPRSRANHNYESPQPHRPWRITTITCDPIESGFP